MHRARLHPFQKATLFMLKPDAKRGKLAHTWNGPYMIVGSHSGNDNFTLQTHVDQKVQRTTRKINDSCPYLDTDDSDRMDASDVLPFHNSCCPVYRRPAATRLQLSNRADVEDRT
jgi:hypothetical protein